MNHSTLILFYDGLCPLCSREIAYFRRRLAGDPLVLFEDIADPAFDASQHGLDPVRIHRVMHVKVDGEIRTGLDALVAIWGRVPGFRWLARLARLPGLRTLFGAGYHLFALVRPLLPRRRVSCPDGTCRATQAR